jgi:hypothetical protein
MVWDVAVRFAMGNDSPNDVKGVTVIKGIKTG